MAHTLLQPLCRHAACYKVTIQFQRFRSSSPIKVKWYYGVDVPIAKPKWYNYKPKKAPEKFAPFDGYDNARLEMAYSMGERTVGVKEDRLFQVDLDKMHLSTIYWKGPVYEVRRGTWFTYEGKPIKQETAEKIEAGYNATQAFLLNRRKVANSPKLPKDLTSKFNDQLQQTKESVHNGDEALNIDDETDIHDLGDGEAVIFFDDVYGALFPSSLSTFQVNIIRSLKPSYGSLMSVVPIQRGFSESLASTVMDSVSSNHVGSLTEYFQSEVATIFDSKAPEEEIKQDESDDSLESESLPNRKIDHLMLCVHGIGQLLGYKYESVNFPHSVNVMRTTMNNIYKNEEKYQKLAYGDAFDAKSKNHKHNNTIQTLPVSWRHRISFHPREPSAYDKTSESHRLPSLSQINVEGIKPLRHVVGDVILDVLLYYEPIHLKQILKAVSSELNDVYKTYKEKNPDFNGKVHLFGHSLGSAICFDLLSQQSDSHKEFKLDFDVENFFCVGSPVGMFELLKQKNIVSRKECSDEDISLGASFSSPKCKNLYNLYHPNDPVSYRMEPLVDPKYAEFQPEEVPFALRGFNTQVQNLSVLGGDIQEKIWQASSWLKKSAVDTVSSDQKSSSNANIAPVTSENALGDIISTLTTPDSQDQTDRTTKVVKYSQNQLEKLMNLNRTGRIDYCLPTGVFDIALVSAISAHISYFEDEQTSGFLMKEILSSSQPPLEERKVTVYKSG